MITELKTKPKGWTIEKMTFPANYSPRSVTWRHKEGIYQVKIAKKVTEETKERMLSMYPDLEEAEIKETKKGLVLTGWYRLDKNYYLYDRADAEKAQ